MGGRVAIVGASARAAAFSSLRAGFVPIGIDLFADADLARRAVAIRVDRYPEGLEAALGNQDVDGWFYTGGLENHPDLIDRLAAKRTLWGNAGASLRAVRDPCTAARAMGDAGVPCPPVCVSPERLPRDGSWLQKPLRASGGAGIRAWTGATAEEAREQCYYQKRAAGQSCSAVFVAAQGRAVLLGATWQLVGAAWTGAGEFCYAGSIGPMPPQPQLDSQWQRIGEAIARHFALVGLFGVDAVRDGGTLWPIEVNPRYPASVEVLERGLGIEAVGMHADACRLGSLPSLVPRTPQRWCGKAILYAPADVVVPREFEDFAQVPMSLWPWPELADVPRPGTAIRAGKPVATVLAEAADEASVHSLIERRLADVRLALGLRATA